MHQFRLVWTTILFCLILWVALSQARSMGAEFFFGQGVGGKFGIHKIRTDDSLVELARQYDVGYNEITAANPKVDPFIPNTGTSITIPRLWILPDVPVRRGIVINLAEMRLYYFSSRDSKLVETFPIGIGDEGWDTPTGMYRIIEKTVNPAWHVPRSIRRQNPELPKIVPPGGDNPLGSHALRLSRGGILIHGTNRPFGIGRRVSHGCIHLYPEDIATLFSKVVLGTGVTIVHQPVKVAAINDWVVVEIHEGGGKDREQKAIDLLKRKGLLAKVDIERLKVALQVKSGMPTDITRK